MHPTDPHPAATARPATPMPATTRRAATAPREDSAALRLPRRRRAAVTGAAGLLLLLTLSAAPALAGGGAHAECPPRGAGSTVVLHDSCFDPMTVTTEGGELRIRNEGFIAHDYVAVDGLFDTGRLDRGEKTRLTAPPPGIYDVYCTLHGTAAGSGMAGTLIVTAADGGTATDEGAAATATDEAAGAPPEPTAAVPARATGTHPASWGALAVAAAALAVAGVALRRSRPVQHPGG